ncbi:MAG: PKD domain-containing protein [Candidatus Eisenbacteria bacterium]|nr:PKD domain-containing protein [Candidatus Eisenbacteria bacterium]
MLRPEHTTISRVWRGIAIVAVIALAMAGGCDWFNDPSQINLPPETTITACPSSLVPPGDDVTIEWEGSDPDGQVVEYQWTFDDTLGGTTEETSMLIEAVEEGTYTFTVASVDNDGDVDASPAECTFAASLGDYVERVVLCELVTTKFCPNCWVADYALVRSLHEFGRENLSVVSYHYSPPPDPLNTEEVTDRCDWYYGFFNIATVFPVTIVDGLTADDGAADTTSTIVAYRMQIEARQAIGSPVSIELDGEIGGSGGSVTATVRVHHQLTGGPHTLRMMVVEDGIDDGAHVVNFVVRDILEEELLVVSAPGDSLSVTRDFVIDDWVLQNLDVVAFVQDDTSAEILQSGRLLTEQ